MSGLPKRTDDKTNTFGIVLIGISSAILLWATIVLLQAYYENTAGPLEARRSAMAKSQKVRDLRARQQAAMRDIRWNPGNETVAIPIEDSMRMVVDDLRADPEALLVPAVGPHDQPTIPAVPGRPVDPVEGELPGGLRRRRRRRRGGPPGAPRGSGGGGARRHRRRRDRDPRRSGRGRRGRRSLR